MIDEYILYTLLILISIPIIFPINLFIYILILIVMFLVINYDTFFIYYKYNFGNIIKFNTHNSTHLGDHIFAIYFINKLKNYIETNNIIIEYYIDSKMHKEIKDFVNSSNVKILDYQPIGYQLHNVCFYNTNSFHYYNFYYKFIEPRSKIPFDLLFNNLFKENCKILNIPIQINNFYNEDQSLLIDYQNLDPIYKQVDILIINSIPAGPQYKVNIKEWDELVKILMSKYKVVTTRKIEGIPCTWDDKLSIKKISAISTKAKIIIAINTGPTTAIFNTFTLEYCKLIYIFDNRVEYITIPQLKNIDQLNQIDMNMIDKIINSSYTINSENLSNPLFL